MWFPRRAGHLGWAVRAPACIDQCAWEPRRFRGRSSFLPRSPQRVFALPETLLDPTSQPRCQSEREFGALWICHPDTEARLSPLAGRLCGCYERHYQPAHRWIAESPMPLAALIRAALLLTEGW